MLSIPLHFLPSVLFTTIAFALKSPQATQTSKAQEDTVVSTPIPTSPPLLTHEHLRRDGSLETCGYTNGDASSPNVCGTSSKCAFFGPPNYYFACCATTSDTFGSDCFSVGACMPWTLASGEGFTNDGASIFSNSVICGPEAPSCATTYIDGVPNVEGPRTHYDCVTGAAAEYRLSQNPTTQAIHVSVVRVTVSDTPTSTTASSTSSTSSSSTSSATSSGATPAVTSSGAEGAADQVNVDLVRLVIAIVAGFFGVA